MPGLKADGSLKAVKLETQVITVDLDTTKSDVGDVAKAIAHTKTPHAKQAPPAAALIMGAKGVAKDDSAKVKEALRDVKGVVAKESSASEGEIVVALDNDGGAKLAEIKKALKKVNP